MKRYSTFTFPLILAAALLAQPSQTPPPPQVAPPPPAQPLPPQQERNLPLRFFPRPAAGIAALEAGPRGRWWTNPEIAKEIGLTADQKKKMDDIFQQHRVSLIDLNASLEKQEVLLEPLVSADQPDESKILAQIDRVAQARAELEKANARMLLGIRRAMTADQWQKLKALSPVKREPGGPDTGGRGVRHGGDPPPAR
jgi:Spy/CpxP family protein refolding chaperone